MTSQRQFMKDCMYGIGMYWIPIFFLIFSDKEGFICCKYHCNTHSDQWVRSQ